VSPTIPNLLNGGSANKIFIENLNTLSNSSLVYNISPPTGVSDQWFAVEDIATTLNDLGGFSSTTSNIAGSSVFGGGGGATVGPVVTTGGMSFIAGGGGGVSGPAPQSPSASGTGGAGGVGCVIIYW
jgi:hypothetical protein